MKKSLNELYAALELSKQAVHQARKRQDRFDQELAELVVLADVLKAEHPGCGVEKMYYTLQPTTMGRDKFCEIFIALGYGVKKIKNFQRTTFPGSIQFPNLIEGMAITRPFQVVQSDITYFDLAGNWTYLTFIIDVYTRLIVGYAVSDNLRVAANLEALNMALKRAEFQPYSMVHHSDRGSQYGSHAYTKRLTDRSIHISMGKAAWENPYAERINGIIKNEFLKRWIIKDLADLKRKVKKAIQYYNTQRKHRAFKMTYTPQEFFEKFVTLDAQERPTVIVYTDGRVNFSGASNPCEVYPREEPLVHICPMGNVS